MENTLLGVALPGPEQFRIPVVPSQLKVGHKYQHLFVGGLRQMENLRVRQMRALIYEPELETVTIKSIIKPITNANKILIIGYQVDGHDRNNYATYPFQSEEELNKYNRQSMDMFFQLDPINRRTPLLHHRQVAGKRGRSNRRHGRRFVTRSSRRKSTRRK
jgi:hypothetical protein